MYVTDTLYIINGEAFQHWKMHKQALEMKDLIKDLKENIIATAGAAYFQGHHVISMLLEYSL